MATAAPGLAALGVGVLAVLLIACAPAAEGPSREPSPASRPDESAVSGEVPEELMGRILDDAARRSGVNRQEIVVVQAIAVTWNDGSLGCPEPGQVYTQALVDGYHVILRAGNQELDYRATASGDFKLCPGS